MLQNGHTEPLRKSFPAVPYSVPVPATSSPVCFPSAPMAPIAHLSPWATQAISNSSTSSSCSEDASTLELSLVTLALVTSAVLSLIPSTHAQAQNNGGRPSLFITVSSIFFALLALAISAVALAFGWSRTVSIDALATVVFGLIPALLSMPLGNIEYAWFRLRMARFKSLSMTYSSFTYVSIDEPCQMPVRAARSKQKGTVSYGLSVQPILYIRHFPHRKAILSSNWKNKYIHAAIPAAKARLTRDGVGMEPLVFHQHRGRCQEHHLHYLVLQNFNNVSEMRWFRSASTATSIIARPWFVYLNTANSGYQGLALLLDIIAFGRLVLRHRLEYLKLQVTTCEAVRKGMRRYIGVVCRAILEEAGLKEWGIIDRDVSANSYSFPDERCKQYGLLFVVMTIKSGIYGEKYDGIDSPSPTLERTHKRKRHLWNNICRRDVEGAVGTGENVLQRVSAQSVLQALRKFEGDHQGFNQLERREVDRWLASWGCSPDE